MTKKTNKEDVKSPSESDVKEPESKEICGIIMPISPLGDYSRSHWSEVREILDSAIAKAGMEAQIVSDSFESDIIQRRIIQNLYENPVVICDVSGLNPNVMFELGIRITFKKPVIIIADDGTKLPFDTGVIEHLFYPKDLHFHKINEFVEALASRVKHMAQQFREGSFVSFIEAFGTFQVLEPSTEAIGADKLVLNKLDSISRELNRLKKNSNQMANEYLNVRPSKYVPYIESLGDNEKIIYRVKSSQADFFIDMISSNLDISRYGLSHFEEIGHVNLNDKTWVDYAIYYLSTGNKSNDIIDTINNILDHYGIEYSITSI